MNSPCVVTLQRSAGEKIIISPEFSNNFKALIFMKVLLNEISFFLKFYTSTSRYLYYNDDFFLSVEAVEACDDLSFETANVTGEHLVKLCFEAAIDFMDKKYSAE